ncbi:type II toxin-antitoxin system RelE/ParE family toxin [Breoghania sp. L-A4]|uniref:type II toxin-antitoxin system RelE/ParE family toxin n=1 Tax=Breoghania sp. L-A4 TaxID=2304600 RepID=UPI0013C345B7|nr:type II toxin-antitoxin system RelE/ParE family toxin [Breoghania sp. L-A4]
MRRYYQSVFPEGSINARRPYEAATIALKANPSIGHPIERTEDVRAYPIPRTPFSFIYRVNGDVIEVLRILDERSGDSGMSG